MDSDILYTVRTYIHTYIHTYIRTYVCTYVYTYLHIYCVSNYRINADKYVPMPLTYISRSMVDVNTHQRYHLEYILSEFTKYSNSSACVPKYILQNNRIHRSQQYVCVWSG